MSNLVKALKRKIEKEKAWLDLPIESKKEIQELMAKGVKEGRQKANERAEFFRKK